jgi:hypothetical protein
MTAQPDTSGPDTGTYQVIHLGGQAAVVVPVADFLRLRALEQAASPGELEDAEDTAACWPGRPATPPGRQRTSRQPKRGAAWACPREPAGRLRRARDQPGSRVPRRPARHPHGPGRHRPAGRQSPPGRVVPYGSPDLQRLRAGRYRVLYEITADAVAIRHIARRIET